MERPEVEKTLRVISGKHDAGYEWTDARLREFGSYILALEAAQHQVLSPPGLREIRRAFEDAVARAGEERDAT